MSEDDGLPPYYVYLEPIEDFYANNSINIEVIVTDRNEIDQVSLFYKFDGDEGFTKLEMAVSYQPVIYEVEIPSDEVISGSLQYYFWATDVYGNQSTWPDGGEDMPVVIPVYTSMGVKKERIKTTALQVIEGVEPKEALVDNLPDYLIVEMLAPQYEIKPGESIPIIVLSVFDPEEMVDLESIKLKIDNKTVPSFNSTDMITHIPLKVFDPGYHIIRYEAKQISGELLEKEVAFYKQESIDGEVETKKNWKEQIKFKGDVGWNADGQYPKQPNEPNIVLGENIKDSHKLNSSVKFKVGEIKFNIKASTSTTIIDQSAREEAKFRQPSSRLKFKMQSPLLDLNFGDSSPEFSEFSLKGTRLRGVNAKIKLGSWETSFASGESKHLVNSDLSVDQISIWKKIETYQRGEKVYDDGKIYEAINLTAGNEPCQSSDDDLRAENSSDSCKVEDLINWKFIKEPDYANDIISNETCIEIEPALYGLNPDISRNIINEDPFDTDSLNQRIGGYFWIWNGEGCEEVLLYSKINMITGKDGLEEGYLYETEDECRFTCSIPIKYQKGSPVHFIQGFHTSNDFFGHAKFGISAMRSWDVRDNKLTPYMVFHDAYTYEGNMVIASDFLLHFFNDKTILSGGYGLSITMDQTFSDTLILKAAHNIDDNQTLYSYAVWDSVDYCYQNECVDINGDGKIKQYPELTDGVMKNDSLRQEISKTRNSLKKYSNLLGFSLNDDVAIGFAEGRGISGLTGPEFSNLLNGGLDSIYLLMKRPSYKINFKTPIPLYFTTLDIQTEISQGAPNYLSHGSSAVQTNVQTWKNKLGFKLLNNKLSFSIGYDRKIKSPWDPQYLYTDTLSDLSIKKIGETIKRTESIIKTGTIGFSFKILPPFNYSIRLQTNEDMEIKYDNGTIVDSTIGLKNMISHTFAPSFKFNLGETNIAFTPNLSLAYDLDNMADTSGCYEILNDITGKQWGGIEDICEGGNNFYYFNKKNNPLIDEGSLMTTFTSAIAFSFKFPLSANFGLGVATNTPVDRRQSETVITVISTKLGYKFFDKTLKIALGANYVFGMKAGNNFWDSNELLSEDINSNGKYDRYTTDQYDDIDLNNVWTEGIDTLKTDGDYNKDGKYDDSSPPDVFVDKIEMNNWKLALKGSIKYKIPEQNISIGLDFNYSKAIDKLKTPNEQKDPQYKMKLALKYNF